MCGKVEDESEVSQRFHEFQIYQEQMFKQQQQQQQYHDGYMGGGISLPEASQILPWSFPPNQNFNPVQFPTNPVREYDYFLTSPSSSSYGGLYSRRAVGYEGSSSSDPLGLAGLYIGSDSLVGRAGSDPFGIQAQLGRMTAQELMDAKALAASKSHSEAERRRRERINKHLARLRSLLPSTTKTDKASLLAEVIQHVKELKRQTSEISEASPLPTEFDELTIDTADEDGRSVIKASLCCDDRSDLLPELIKTLKALRLRTLKAEITTLGGRVKNVLLIAGEEESKSIEQQSISSIQEALKAVMERSAADDSSSGSLKRQRTTNISILENRSI